MFGYVNIYKDELKIKDYNVFNAYYCGLCREIGAHGSHIARLGLSYDMTFLCILLSAVDGEPYKFGKGRCLVHPFHKRAYVTGDRAVEYSAYMSVILAYLKLADDWHDERSFKARVGMIAYSPAVKRARRKYPQTYDKVKALLDKLSAYETAGETDMDEIDIDTVADCFAKITALLFVPDYIEDEPTRRTLEWLGYNIGRWIYIIDAYADIEKDIKSGGYNMFKRGDATADEIKASVRERLDDSLTLTLANAAAAYDLLDIKKNKDILDNILLLSLAAKQREIIFNMGKEIEKEK